MTNQAEDRSNAHPLAPLVRPGRPVPVVVSVEGESWPGLVMAWRGDRILAEFTTGLPPGIKYLKWLPADNLTRVVGFMHDVDTD